MLVYKVVINYRLSWKLIFMFIIFSAKYNKVTNYESVFLENM
jgi:hypothetical protein